MHSLPGWLRLKTIKLGGSEKQRGRLRSGKVLLLAIFALSMVFVAYVVTPTLLQSMHPERRSLSAAIVDQLSANYPSQEFIETARSVMRQAGFNVDIYAPEKVNVSLYETLPAEGHRLIVFRVHIGTTSSSPGQVLALFTSQRYNTVDYLWEQVYDQVLPAFASNRSQVVFSVTSKFIKEKSIADYRGTVIFLMGCIGLYSTELAQAFVDRGASVVIGWDGMVSAKHTDETTLTFLKTMLLDKMLSLIHI